LNSRGAAAYHFVVSSHQQSAIRVRSRFVFATLVAVAVLMAVSSAKAATPVDFAREVRPLLLKRCLACHDAEHAKGGLRLDSREAALKGGKSKQPTLVPGAPAKSELVKRITTHDPDELMPPKGGALTSAQIALLTRWIAEGANWPADSSAKHWSFVPPVRPAMPPVKNKSWPRNPVDHFILAKLEERGWQPSAQAEKRTLLRRVFLDLTGLPPTLAEQDKFLADNSRDAFAKLVDDLLARTSYGERWGRHWLDLARYAETNGYERDAIKPNVWRYRDYVIAAFNTDKPYDRFIREQVAGDELPDANAETLIATGFHRLGPWDDEPADQLQDRADQVDDMIRTTSQAFLGVTLGCARCHDHKFDPLTARDYYSLAAVFAPLKRTQSGRSDLDAPAGTRAELAALAQRAQRIAALTNEVAAVRLAFRAQFLASGKSALPAEVVAAFQTDARQQTPAQKELVKKFTPQLDEEVTKALPAATREKIGLAEAAIAELRRVTPDLPRGYFPAEPSPAAPKSFVLLRGSAHSPGPEVFPAVPVALTPKQPGFPAPDEFTTRRRLTLANWIASPDNPLTARVLVNRVWQHHFGEGLVRTPSDFGLIGSAPTHPELLDWLADWFVKEGGWSLKKLHRLILASATWQQASSAYALRFTHYADVKRKDVMRNQTALAAHELDPENLLLSRFPCRRLEVEAIRDSMLAVSGRLNPRVGGPSMYPEVPKEALAGSSDPDKIWKPFDEADASRRTVYAFLKRSFVVPMLEVLDVCDTTQSSDKRAVTSIAPQALTLFNGEFVNRQARHFADRLKREAGANAEAQIQLAWRLALARAPKPDELTAMQRFLAEETASQLKEATAAGKNISADEAAHAALTQMCRVVLNLNEFVYPD
jgi:mono/diheme cytochrome c family protein